MKKTTLTLLLTIGGTIGFGYVANLAAGNKLGTQSIYSVFIAFALYLLLDKTLSQPFNRRRIIFSGLFAWFIGITLVTGYQIRMLGMTSGGISGKLFLLFMGFLAGIIPWLLIDFLFRLASAPAGITLKENASMEPGSMENCKKTFFLSWGIIFLCWIPVFLAYYPAIMAYDFNVQSIQVVQEAYHTHHPLIHTGLLWIFFQLGKAAGSYQLGMALFALLQMLVMSCIFGYSCTFIRRFTGKRTAVAVAILFYGVLPVNSVLSVSITKDVLFSGFFLLFLLLLLERNIARNRKLFLDICLIPVGILMLLFRNNAIYAFIPFAVFFVLINRREWLRPCIVCVLITVLSLLASFGLKTGLHADTGSISEMCSVPMQQFARVGYLHGNELSREDYACIDRYVYDDYWQRYNPPIADTVKITVAADGIEHWEENLPRTVRDWIKIGLHYPNEYLDAFFCLTSGYWFLDDVSYAEVLGSDLESRMGILYTFNASQSAVFEGIESHSLFPWLETQMENIVSANAFFQWPVLSQLFKPAVYCLLLFFGLLVFCYRKDGKKAVFVLFPLLYLTTLLLGPVALMRYAYPFVVWAPVLVCMIFLPKSHLYN